MSARRLASRAIIRCDSLRVSHAAMVVLAVMATWADPRDADPVCFKEQESIARRAKISESTLRRALVELERAGLIKRLGIVGGHATKRGTIKWGLILLSDDNPFAVTQTDKQTTPVTVTDKADAPLSVTQTDKQTTPVTVTDKQPVTQTDKGAVTVTANSSQSQSDPKGATDDDDSAALAATPSAGAPGSPPAALTGLPGDQADALTRMVVERTGWNSRRAGQWIDGKLTGRRVGDPEAYLTACLDDLDARAAQRTNAGKGSTPIRAPSGTKRAGKATGSTPPRDRTPTREREPVRACARCGTTGVRVGREFGTDGKLLPGWYCTKPCKRPTTGAVRADDRRL